jgi:NADPH:quinone reductase-like Zn-dependent oxidoreductase
MTSTRPKSKLSAWRGSANASVRDKRRRLEAEHVIATAQRQLEREFHTAGREARTAFLVASSRLASQGAEQISRLSSAISQRSGANDTDRQSANEPSAPPRSQSPTQPIGAVMQAAVVTDFSKPPRYEDFPEPVARSKDEVVVEVLAAGLHPRVRSQAGGFHYTSTGELPLVPGVDAVVRDPKGKLRYAIIDVDETTLGTMAQRTVIERDRSVVLPDDIDPVLVAAAMNPAMSSWIALRRRIDFGRRQRVLILGATGNAGRMAIQVAKRFGAAEVIGAGRDEAKLAELPALGADRALPYDQLGEAADVDVVIDYVWGEPTATAMVDLLTNRSDRSKPLTWIEIGAIAGPQAQIPAAALRSARLQIVGSGIGSVPGRDFVRELPKLVKAVGEGAFDVRARAVPLSEVEQTWTSTAGTRDRIVLVP